jgi:lysyl-tRNA synthetase class 2
VERTRVTSRVIRSVGYDADVRVLEVELVSDHLYRYREVPPFLYEGLLAAKSKGAFFNRRIARRFEYEPLK